MNRIRRNRLAPALAAAALAAVVTLATAGGPDVAVSDRVKQFTRATPWKPTGAIPVNFNTHHPQGMVKIGEIYYVSSVEIITPTKRFPIAVGGYDRDTGEGKGHLFRIDSRGNLLADLPLGEGSIYHPGGIDFDGKYIWVPVAEYRPNSKSIIYRVDPKTMKAEEVLRYDDHIGGIVHNLDDGTLHGVSWGSRRFYRWILDRQGKVTNADVAPETLRKPNRSHYIDYQDCKFVGRSEMLCSGLNNYQPRKDGPRLALGGLEIVDLVLNRPVHQVPVELWTESGLPMTQNPFWIENTAGVLRAYFMPEDEKSTIYIYEVGGN